MHTFKLPKALPPNSISKCVPVCQVDRRISYRQTVNPSILNPPTVYVQHHMTDDRTPSQKDDCIWGRAVGFAAGWSEVGTVFEGFHWADWSHLFYPALPHTGSDRLPNSKHLLLLRSFASILSPESPSATHSRPLSFAAHAFPSPPAAIHVPLGVLVAYEGMRWSQAPSWASSSPVPAPRSAGRIISRLFA